MGILLNIVNSLLGYKDSSGVVSNPLQRSFDWSRRYTNVPAENGTSDEITLQPGQSQIIFDGTRSPSQAFNPSTTQLSLDLLSLSSSTYRLSVASGAGQFRTPRAINFSSATSVSLVVNNNAIATITINSPTTESFVSVQIGDVLRIRGYNTGDTSDIAFSAINSGYWTVISSSAASVTVKRPSGQSFSGASETVTIGSASTQDQLSVYSSIGIQIGDSFSIQGTLSQSSYGNYSVLRVSPTSIDFVSGTPLAQEHNKPLSALSDVVFYSDAKKLLYVEVDQNCAVRFNGQSDNLNVITPIQVGQESLPGYLNKWGYTWKCEVVNLSQVDSLNVKWIAAD